MFDRLLTACAGAPVSPGGESGTQTYYSEAVHRQVIEEGPIAANSDDSNVKCRRVRKPGSHFAVRVCRTTEEWDAISNETRRDLHMRQANESLTPASPEPGG